MARATRSDGLNYRDLQKANGQRRDRLTKADRAELKRLGFRNVGWDNVIRLSQQLDELLGPDPDPNLPDPNLPDPNLPDPDLPSLESLFLEADRIGNAYQSAEEIAAFNQALAEASSAVDEAIDRQFPDNDVEIVHFQSSPVRGRSAKRNPRR
jgi:hypothetical protein